MYRFQETPYPDIPEATLRKRMLDGCSDIMVAGRIHNLQDEHLRLIDQGKIPKEWYAPENVNR